MDETANLLLRVFGETDEAEGDLDQLAAKLAAFNEEEAEATVEVDNTRAMKDIEVIRKSLASLSRQSANPDVEVDIAHAQVELARMQVALERLDLTNATPDVEVATAGAMAKLAAFRLYLDELDSKNVTIDVDVRRDFVSRMGQVVGEVGRVTGAVTKLDDAAQAASGSIGGGGGVTASFGGFMGLSPQIIAAVLALAAVIIGALVAGLAALISSLALAVAGLAALGVALGGAFLAALPLIIGGIKIFKDEMNKAGTAANALKHAAVAAGRDLIEALGPGVRRIFAGLAQLLRTIAPAIQQLKQPFTLLGRAIRDALAFAGPGIAELIAGFGQLVREVVPLVGPMVDTFVAFGKVLQNIAIAAMPFLVEMFQQIRSFMEGLAQSTSNIDGLRAGIGGLISHLASWLNLIKQISALFLAFFRAAAPAGQQLVNWIAQGAQKWAAWINSAKGQEIIRKFFVDVIPLVQQILVLIGRLIVLFFQLVQAVAPLLTTVLTVFNTMISVLSKVIQFLMPVIQAALKLGAVIGGPVAVAINAIIFLFQHFSDIATAVWDGIKAAATWCANAIKDVFNAVKSVVEDVFGGIGNVAKVVLAAIIGPWAGLAAVFVTAFNTIKNAAEDVFGAIGDAASAAWDQISGKVDVFNEVAEAAKQAASSSSNALRGVSSVANGVFAAVVGTAQANFAQIPGIVQGAVGGIRAALSVDLSGAGQAMVASFARGIMAGAGAAIAAARSVAASVRAVMPGSEPKDSRSPLRNLAAAGAAIVRNTAEGIRRAGPALILALEQATSGIQTRLELLGYRIDRLKQQLSSTTGKSAAASALRVQLREMIRDATNVQHVLEHMIPRINNLLTFQNAVMDLKDTLADLARQGRDTFISIRQRLQEAAIDNSAEGQELAALLAGGTKEEFDLSITQSGERLSDLNADLDRFNAELADPGRTRSISAIQSDIVNTGRAIRDEEANQAKLRRDARIIELQKIISDRKAAVDQQAQDALDGFDKEANAYEASLNRQLNALATRLAKGKISYAQFVKAVRKILGPLHVPFEVSNDIELALRGGRSFIEAFTRGMKDASGQAKAVLRGILRDLRNMLPGSEPKDRSSPLFDLAKPGKAVMANFAAGITDGGGIVMKALYDELAPVAQVMLNPTITVHPMAPRGMQPAGRGTSIGKLVKNFNIPPGPGGGLDPLTAATQIDKLLQNEGGLA